MNRFLAILIFSNLLVAGTLAAAYDPFDYKSGYTTIQELGRDIYRSLDPAQQSTISEQPISLDTSSNPFVRPLRHTDGARTIRGVWISQGLIDLVNHLAHAQAIDKKRKGYFTRYLRLLETPMNSLPALPDRENSAFWTDAVLNEQLSNFNSIMGIVVGINLAQQSLGFYEKYEQQINGSQTDWLPLNSLITKQEWEDSYRKGLTSAMKASCMIEGYIPLCDGLNSMKHRPSWAVNFLPESISFATMRKDMAKLQRTFLNH